MSAVKKIVQTWMGLKTAKKETWLLTLMRKRKEMMLFMSLIVEGLEKKHTTSKF